MGAKCSLSPVLLLGWIAFGCGGGTVEAPGLEHRVPEQLLVDLPFGERRSVIAAHSDHSTAKTAIAWTEVALAETDKDLEVAQNRRERALLRLDSARAELRFAERFGDREAHYEAKDARREASRAVKAAEARIAYLETRRIYLVSELEARRARELAMEARYELEKARLARNEGREPEDFSLRRYREQYRAHARRAARLEREARRARNAAEERLTRASGR